MSTTRRHHASYGHLLRTLLLLVMMTAGVTAAWAQTDYSGTYYIASCNVSNNASRYSDTPANNYYLCPTDEEDWICYVHPDNYTNPASDNDQPFLTTYKYRASGADATKAVWIIEKAPVSEANPNLEYYYLKHKDSNRYLTYNGPISTTTGGGVNRLRVHMQSTPNNNSLFRITLDATDAPAVNIAAVAAIDNYFYTDKGKSYNCIYINVSSTDHNSLKGTEGKKDGPTGYTWVGATVGIWYDPGHSSEWYLEEVVKRPTITIDGSGIVTITAEEGTTIRYTTNGDAPTGSTATTVSNNTTTFSIPTDAVAIKAIAVRTSDSEVSNVATLSFPFYTYNIVDTQGNIAIKYTVNQLEGLALSNTYTSIPEAIRSPYLEDETVTFYSTLSAEGSRNNLSDLITSTPAGGGNIYVSYTTDHLGDKPLHLRGTRQFKIRVNGEYFYDRNGALRHSASDGNDDNTYLWKVAGNDPYRVQIQNLKNTGHHFKWSTDPSASLTLGASASNFIILGGNVTRPSGVPEGFDDQVELMAATGEDISSNPYYNVGFDSNVGLLASGTYGHSHAAIQVLLKAVQRTTTFHIIDMSGRIVVEQTGNFDELDVPAQWKSPLVQTYHFWTHDNFRVSNGVYTLRLNQSEIADFASAPADIYVTYDPSDEYDLDGSENRATDGKKYLLKFADGTSFNQEKDDGFETTPDEGIYPYINGEGGLFVYGQDKKDATEGAVASTRTRWAWYLEGGDPYRLRISSLQTKTDGKEETHHSYLRTYKPQDYTEVVTGVISDNPTVYDGSNDAHATRHKPTDYMILNGTNGHFKLVTSDVVDDLDGNAANDVRHTVTSFENYWKTNPTAANVIHDYYENDGDAETSFKVGDTPEDYQITAALTTGPNAKGWHTYYVWANGSTWASSSKSFGYEKHWFKTIGVGTETETEGVYNGDFDLEEYELDAALILLDKHGWEVMRKPITNRTSDKAAYATELRKYDSPMVKKYHFWTKFIKEDGYHKYKPIRGKEKESDNAKHQGEGTSLADYPEVFSGGTLADIYVTYEVMSTYRDSYICQQATNPKVSKYLIRQGEDYAKTTDGTNITLEPVANVSDVSTAGNELLWNVKPNINIDAEMGYHYKGDGVARFEEETQSDTELGYYNNRNSYYTDNTEHHPNDTIHDPTNGQNGFDPYNLQIESVAYSGKLFTTNATGAGLDRDGGLASTYEGAKTVGLQTYATVFDVTTNYYDSGTGYQILHVTNSTFMAVSDANGNIRLMPRFDHHNVVELLVTLEAQQDAEPYGDESGDQTTLFVLPSSPTPSGEQITVSSSDEITDMDGNYLLDERGFDVTKVIGTAAKPFRGTIDGQMVTIDGLSRPLVAYADGATIKNVIVKTVSINAGNADGNAGAICCQATGATRIYNCGILPTTTERDEEGNITGFTGSHVIGSANVGGIVGLLSGNARVINCFSYAEIKGGTTVAGIVGNIGYAANKSITQDDVNTKPMVVNCMFYGDITGGSSISPVYGGATGAMIKNDADKGVNPYCYFRKNASFDNAYTNINDYKRSWPAEEKNLTRFEYYRSILNSNKRLCTYWVTDKVYGSATNAPTEADEALIAKWVLDPSIAPYPVLKPWGKYPSVINLDPENRFNPSTQSWEQRSKANEWEGKSYGTLEVTINAGSHNSGAAAVTKDITITDMDTLNCDFCYYKIQLPYYNEIFGNPEGATHALKYGNNYTDEVVTGWEITTVTPSDDYTGTRNSFTANWETGYNFADRNCIDKDLYSGTNVGGRVFAQGGYYYVPTGVKAISITAHWGKAVYLANRGYSIDRAKLTAAGYKEEKAFAPAGTIPNKFQTDYDVYDDLQDAIKALEESSSSSYSTVYDQAIVLISNHQVKNGSNGIGYGLDSKWHYFTIMSADFDFDNEPDNCLQLQFRHDIDRPGIQPVRFDFLPVIELGLAVRHDKKAYAIGIFVPQGHFEITETAFMRTTQFEYDGPKDDNHRVSGKSPMIINGGEFESFNVRYRDPVDRTSYFLMGGKAWIHRFAPGAHPSSATKTHLCAVNAIGGEYPEFYLSGLYRAGNATPANQGAPHCYTNGGKFGTVAGAGYDKVAGGVTFKINHSLIKEFYGGGINGSNPIGGNIDVTIDYSRVNRYCGGPKVGNMTGKTVTTHATGTTFGVFYGGGNGGNSYYRNMEDDGDWNTSDISNEEGFISDWSHRNYHWGTFNPLRVKDDGTDNKGYHAEYEFEVFNQSNGVADKVTQRGFIRWIQFGITTTGDVSNTLKDCTVNTDFFGGGNLATVDGTVTSTLTNTIVKENVFGAGFSASIPTFTVHDNSNAVFPSMDFAGTITDGYIPNKQEDNEDIEYEWTNDLYGKSEGDRKADPAYYKMVGKEGEQVKKWYCYTWNPLDNLGAVLNNVTLTLAGETVVGTEGDPTTGNVYGGGDASAVGHVDDKPNDGIDDNIIANTTVYLQGNTRVLGNVFGGGNNGLVNGNATVIIRETPTNNNGSGNNQGEGQGNGQGN